MLAKRSLRLIAVFTAIDGVVHCTDDSTMISKIHATDFISADLNASHPVTSCSRDSAKAGPIDSCGLAGLVVAVLLPLIAQLKGPRRMSFKRANRNAKSRLLMILQTETN